MMLCQSSIATDVVQARKVLELLPYKAQQANQLVLFTKLNSLALLTVPLLLKPPVAVLVRWSKLS